MVKNTDSRLDRSYRSHKKGQQVAALVDRILKLDAEQTADLTLTLVIEHKIDLAVLFDKLVQNTVDTYTEAEFSALVNFVDTTLDVIKQSGRVAKVSVHG